MEEHSLETSIELSNVVVDDFGFVLPPENMDHSTDDEAMEEVRSKTSDASGNDSTMLSPAQNSSRSSHEADSKRKFRIVNLKHNGEWRNHEKLQDMLTRCESFHASFEPHKKKLGVKLGAFTLSFNCPEAARIAFAEAQKFVVDGALAKLQASKCFYETSRRPIPSFPLSEDFDMRERTLYAVYLLESTSESVLRTIFDDIENVTILPLTEHRYQAELVMKSKEAALSAKEDADGFELSDGENNSVMKVCFGLDYVEFISLLARPPLLSPNSSAAVNMSRSSSNASSCSKPSLSPTKSVRREEMRKEERKKEVKPIPVPSLPLPLPLPLPSDVPEFEPSLEEVAAAISLIVEEERINYAEMNEKEELYALVDKASYKLGGVRDELLRDAFLSVMESARSKASEDNSSWMRRHLDELIKLWKKEMASGVSFDRPSRVPLQTRIINPIPMEKKRKRGGGATLRAQFGLGSILAAARAKFATEEGELDIEERDDGNILIGDVPLSFDSWARFNQQPLKRIPPKEEQMSETTKANRRVKRMKMEEEKQKKKEAEKAKKEADKPRKELEEGEMDSDDSDKKGSSSSSDSSESDEEGDSRRRRRFRRKNDRSKPPTLPPLFQSIYDNRVAIIGALSVEHRVAFSKVLNQFVNQKGGIDSTQQKTLMTYMANFQR